MRICPQCGTETSQLTCRNDGFGTVDAARYRQLDPKALIGTLFQDRFRVDRVLGSGGMGSVYEATQIGAGRKVALKVINAALANNLDVVARFQREGRAISGLIHPNIVQVFDFGQSDDGQLFIAMELMQGKTLADLVAEEGPLAPERVVDIAIQIFDALTEAHDQGVVHRDLKPANIFVSEGQRHRDVIKILDFGVAKIANDPSSESVVTSRGAVVGSPKYMAPEQARGKGVTGHADLYAVGGILYELLTGRSVFDEPSPADYLVAHSVKMPPPIVMNGKPLHGPLVDLIMRCLEKKPWNRPDGAARAMEAAEAARLAPIIRLEDEGATRLRHLPSAGGGKAPPPLRAVPPPIPGTGEAQALPAEAVVAPADRPAMASAIPLPFVTRPHMDAQSDPTTLMEALPIDAGFRTVPREQVFEARPAEERRRRSAGLFWTAALVLLIGGGVIFLATQNFFQPRAGGPSGVVGGVITDTAAELGPSAVRSGPAYTEAALALDPTARVPAPAAAAERADAAASKAETAASRPTAVAVTKDTAPKHVPTPPEPKASTPTTPAVPTKVRTAGTPEAPRSPPKTPTTTARVEAVPLRPVTSPTAKTPAKAPAQPPSTYEDPFATLEDPDFPSKHTTAGPKVRVTVNSTPSGATIRMGSQTLGTTPIRVDMAAYGGKPVKVLVEKDGYYPYPLTLPASGTTSARLVKR